MTTQDNPTTKSSRRKAVDSFLHDSNARNDQKILRLRARGGWEYYGLYWAVIEVLRESSDYRIQHDALEAVALSLAVRDQHFVTFISTCCQIGLLEQDEVGYFSPALLARMERYQQTIERRKQAGSKGGSTRAAKLELVRSNPVAIATALAKQELSKSDSDATANAKLNNNSNSNLSIKIGSEGSVGTDARATLPAPPPEPDDPELEAFADRHLVKSTDPLVAGHPLWMGAGKRPMKKYPNLWIAPLRLREVATLYEQSGIPAKEWHLGFRYVAARIDKAVAEGKSLTSIDAYVWLIGFGLQHALEQRAKSLNVQRQEKYLGGTK